MDILIIGGGLVGGTLARDLQNEHEITIVEAAPGRARELELRYDVLVIRGNGTSLETLQQARAAQADVILASTDDDETNLVACSTASAISDALTVARVRSIEYYESWKQGTRTFGVDHLVCTDFLVGTEISNLLSLPEAHYVETFANGMVLAAEFDVAADASIANHTVSDADRFDSLTFAAFIENGSVTIPDGDSVINPGSRVVVIGSRESVGAFGRELVETTSSTEKGRVVIVGGSGIGVQSARMLSQQGFPTVLVEEDEKSARALAEKLPEVRVINTEVTDVEFFEAEQLGSSYALVAALQSEAENLLECVLGEELGINRTIAITDHPKFIELFERLGVDVALCPRNLVAGEFIGITQEWNSEKVALIETDLAEVVEVEIGPDSLLTDRPIAESQAGLDHEVVIGAIIREGEFITPRGDTIVEVGDHVVLFVDADAVVEAKSLI